MVTETIRISLDEKISRYINARAKAQLLSPPEVVHQLLADLYQKEIERLHQSYLHGDITLRGMARRLGLSYRELFQMLEEQGKAI
jgi:N-dimethylarginine dimethylaminohydrolase